MKKFFELYSLILNPLVLIVVLYIIALIYSPVSANQALIVSTFQIIIPLVFYTINLIQKKIDFDMTIRNTRIPILIVSMLSFSIGTFFIYSWGYTRELITQIGILLILIIFTVITTRWKISFHSLMIAMSIIFLWKYFGAVYLYLGIIIIPVMMVARVYLKRHTIMQTVAGIGLGSTILLFF